MKIIDFFFSYFSSYNYLRENWGEELNSGFKKSYSTITATKHIHRLSLMTQDTKHVLKIRILRYFYYGY